jgi:hypothetical protein
VQEICTLGSAWGDEFKKPRSLGEGTGAKASDNSEAPQRLPLQGSSLPSPELKFSVHTAASYGITLATGQAVAASPAAEGRLNRPRLKEELFPGTASDGHSLWNWLAVPEEQKTTRLNHFRCAFFKSSTSRVDEQPTESCVGVPSTLRRLGRKLGEEYLAVGDRWRTLLREPADDVAGIFIAVPKL